MHSLGLPIKDLSELRIQEREGDLRKRLEEILYTDAPQDEKINCLIAFIRMREAVAADETMRMFVR